MYDTSVLVEVIHALADGGADVHHVKGRVSTDILLQAASFNEFRDETDVGFPFTISQHPHHIGVM
jgi:hypothetical protein